jgi:hypothetical protein
MSFKRKNETIKNNFHSWLRNEKLNIKRIDQIPEWFLKNQRTIPDAVNAGCKPVDKSVFIRNEEFFEHDYINTFYFESIAYWKNIVQRTGFSEHIVNTTLNTNFETKNFAWTGYVSVSMIRDQINTSRNYPISAALNLIDIITGSGGGGNLNCGYSIAIHLKDWPGLIDEFNAIQEDIMVKRLKGLL